MTIIEHARKALFGSREAAPVADDLSAGERQLLLASFRNGVGRRPIGVDFDHRLSVIEEKLKGTPSNVLL